MQTSQTNSNRPSVKSLATPAKNRKAKPWPFLVAPQANAEEPLIANARRIIATTASQLGKH